MKTYSTLIFDAFETLIHFNNDKLTECRVRGQTVFTTAPAIHAMYEEDAGPVDFERFVEAFFESFREAGRRAADLREVPCPDRFRIMLELLGKDPDSLAEDFPDRLATTHMSQLEPAMEVRPENRGVLEWAGANGYRVAMISNFDHAPTLHRCLERHGLHDTFEAVVVSDDVGWRKPHPRIFEHAFEALGIEPSEGLFIGDRLDLDIDGAAGVGMDAVWVDTGRYQWSPRHAQPRHTVQSLDQLVPILATGTA